MLNSSIYFAKCHYPECQSLNLIMVSVTLQSIILCFTLINVTLLSAILLNIVIPRVLATSAPLTPLQVTEYLDEKTSNPRKRDVNVFKVGMKSLAKNSHIKPLVTETK